MTNEQIRLRQLDREAAAFRLIVRIAGTDPSISGFRTLEQLKELILKEHKKNLAQLEKDERDSE
jgi:hypothetical protein